jgi:hypothetical protein
LSQTSQCAANTYGYYQGRSGFSRLKANTASAHRSSIAAVTSARGVQCAIAAVALRVASAEGALMSRSHRRAAGTPDQEPTTEAHPSVAAEDEDERRSRQALVDYFRILQEWSLNAQAEGAVGDQRVVSGATPKVPKPG